MAAVSGVGLSQRDAQFGRWWQEQRVATFRPRRRWFRRPDGSTFALEHHRLQLVAAPTVWIIVYLPVPPARGRAR